MPFQTVTQGGRQVRIWIGAPDEDEKPASKESERIRPPGYDDKIIAEYMCWRILERCGITEQDATVIATGSEYLECKTCKARGEEKFRVKWFLKACPRCNTPTFQPPNFHSSCSFTGESWRIILANDVSIKRRPIKQVADVMPAYGVPKTGRETSWPMYINICWHIAPIVYAKVKGIKPWTFSIPSWTAEAPHRRAQYARVIAKLAEPVFMEFAGVIVKRDQVADKVAAWNRQDDEDTISRMVQRGATGEEIFQAVAPTRR